MSQSADCLIALGANLGRRDEQLNQAVACVAEHPAVEFVSASTWHATAPIGGPKGQGEFLNGALRLATTLSPSELFSLSKKIERDLGRSYGERWGPRVIDLDLLLYGREVVDDEIASSETDEVLRLQLPHPRMAFRRFVLAPAAEIAADMVHPILAWTVGELLHHAMYHPPLVTIAACNQQRGSQLAEHLAHAIGGRLIRRAEVDSAPIPAAPSERSAIEYIAAFAALLPAVESWPQDQWIVCEFDPVESLREVAGDPAGIAVAELNAAIIRPKLRIVDGTHGKLSPPAPALDVTDLPFNEGLQEAIAAAQSMQS